MSKNDTKSLVRLRKKLKGEACIGVVMVTVQVYLWSTEHNHLNANERPNFNVGSKWVVVSVFYRSTVRDVVPLYSIYGRKNKIRTIYFQFQMS